MKRIIDLDKILFQETSGRGGSYYIITSSLTLRTRKTMIQSEQGKYTMDPGLSSLSQQKEKTFWSKMIFEQKQIRKMHKSCIIND